jgi:hypothetical protein
MAGSMPLRVEEDVPAPAPIEDLPVLRGVLASRTFRKAPALRALLQYLWDHRSIQISEHAIAVEALGRRPDFDPKADATVRVHVMRLRQKLKEYYEAEAAGAGYRLTLPAGTYHLQVTRTETAPLQEAMRNRPAIVLFCLLVLVSAALIWQLRSEPTVVIRQPPASPVAPFLQQFLAGPRPARLVIPTPVFFQWEGQKLRVRDVEIDDFTNYERSPQLQVLAQRFGKPTLTQRYTVTSDTLASINLVQSLAMRGYEIEAGVTGDLELESFRDRNIIFVGIPATSPHLKRYLERTNFRFASSSEVTNQQPAPGEPAAFQNSLQSPGRAVRVGLITMLPGRGSGTRILLLAGHHTASLVTFLTSSAEVKSLQDKLSTGGSPEYFEAVVRSEIEGNRVLKASLLAFRAIALNQ